MLWSSCGHSLTGLGHPLHQTASHTRRLGGTTMADHLLYTQKNFLISVEAEALGKNCTRAKGTRAQ